ncbi:putative Ig domain-containing protein, partial [Bradyrhizobium sp.]|uniref:putative Ig domain-containing protein n=1 Tax=Bradyrhizobium sp. TaxID=376 RepID=UPI003C227B21
SPIPDSPGHSQFGDFSALVINANLQGEGNFFNDFSPFHPDAYVVHVDVHATVADNGAITFNLPLSQLDAALDGDVVSVTATLADGRPLPAWLQFDGDTGQFAGLLPENNATGSIGPDGGNSTGQPLDTHVPSTLLQSITIEVVARDSKGNLAITDFTIDISELKRHSSELKRHGSEQHGWNLSPGDGFVEPFATNLRGRDHAIDLAPGSHRELAPLHAMDRVLWHDVATFDIGRVHGDHGNDHPPAGRAGLSDQIKTLGWHGATAERNALLDSLRLGVAGWR